MSKPQPSPETQRDGNGRPVTLPAEPAVFGRSKGRR